MKKIKSYKLFNESLRDKLKGKSDEEVINSFTKLMNDYKYYTVKNYIDDINKEIHFDSKTSIEIQELNRDRTDILYHHLSSFKKMSELTNTDPSDLIVVSEDEPIYNNIHELFSSLNFVGMDNKKIELDDEEYYHRVYPENKIIYSSPTDYDGVNTIIFSPEFIINKLKNR